MAIDTGNPGVSAPPGSSVGDAMDQLALMKTARRQERDDLQEIADGLVGTTAATILAFNQAKINDAVLGLDPNHPIDQEGDEEEDQEDPLSQAAESSS